MCPQPATMLHRHNSWCSHFLVPHSSAHANFYKFLPDKGHKDRLHHGSYEYSQAAMITIWKTWSLSGWRM